MAEVKWTEPALAQLSEAVDLIALDNPEAARRVARNVFAALENLERFQKLGRPVPELPHPNHRQIWIKPLWIYYRLDVAGVVIINVKRAEKLLHLDDILEENE